jgi:serine phosphatase RsbU (regulator of sigma subunit)
LQRIFYISLLFFLLLCACQHKQPPPSPLIQEGKLNLRTWNFEEAPLVALQGEWEFYWGELLGPQQINAVFPHYAYIPGAWEEGPMPRFGHATYSCILELPAYEQAKDFALYLPNLAMAYKVWFNNLLVQEVGKVGVNPQNYAPQYRSSFLRIPNSLITKNKKLRITIQVANFSHFRSGFYHGLPRFGKYTVLAEKQARTRAFELFEIGALLFMGFYHLLLFLYLFPRREQAPLYLALICFCVIVRTLIVNVGSQYWYELFAQNSYSFIIRLEFLVTYALIPLMLLFVRALFPQETPRKLFLGISLFGLALLALVLVAPTFAVGLSLYAFYPLALTGYIFQIFVVSKAIRHQRTGALTLFIGFFVSFVFTIVEVAYHLNLLYLPYSNLATIGIFVFLFFQSFVIANRFSRAFFQAEYLSKNLERKVKERTEALEEQNKVIAQINEGMVSSIQYAKRIQEALLPQRQSLREIFPEHFVFYRPRDIVSGDFYWCIRKANKAYMAVVDCTGHGVPGALMSMLGFASLNYIASQSEALPPEEMLRQLDEQVRAALNQEGDSQNKNYDGMVVALACLELDTLALRFAGAERTLLWIRDGELKEIPSSRHIIGGNFEQQQKHFFGHTLQLRPQDRLYMFTDGYPDQFGGSPKKRKFSTRKFKDLLLQIHLLPMEAQRLALEQGMQHWQGAYSQIDDMLVVGLHIC